MRAEGARVDDAGLTFRRRERTVGARSGEQAIEHNGVREEEHRDDHRQPRQVPLDDVRPTLRTRGEPHATQAGIAARVHQNQRDKRCREKDVDDREECEHLLSVAQDAPGKRLRK